MNLDDDASSQELAALTLSVSALFGRNDEGYEGSTDTASIPITVVPPAAEG